MPIKINHVRIFEGTHARVAKEYLQIIVLKKPKFGEGPKIVTILETKDAGRAELNKSLREVDRLGETYTAAEKHKFYDVWIPKQEDPNASLR